LINQFDIYTLSIIKIFEFKQESKNRTHQTITAVLGCKIREIWRDKGPNLSMTTLYRYEGYRWVRIQGAEYWLERKQIIDWLSFWGKLASDITEDKIEEDIDDSEGGHSIGNRTYTIKMKLDAGLSKYPSLFGFWKMCLTLPSWNRQEKLQL
jgi:hypothetical protein